MTLRYQVLGTVLIVAAIVGFVAPGALPFVTPRLVHHAAHLSAGVCAIGAARRGVGAMRAVGKVLGLGFVVLAVAGFVTENSALAWMHVGVAVVFFYHALLAPPTL